jgi:alpha-amylase
MHASLDNLIWVHEHLANGGTITRFLDDTVIVLNRTGQPGLLTGLNFDTFNARTITCATSFGANVHLHDYSGHHHDIFTDGGGNATFTIPSNAFNSGRSYVCFSRIGLDAPHHVHRRSTTQTIFGATDLDVMPAGNGARTAGCITADRNTGLTLTVRLNRHGWSGNSHVRVQVNDPHGHAVIDHDCKNAVTTMKGNTDTAGEYVFVLTGQQLPDAGSSYEIDVTYTAPQIL